MKSKYNKKNFFKNLNTIIPFSLSSEATGNKRNLKCAVMYIMKVNSKHFQLKTRSDIMNLKNMQQAKTGLSEGNK